MLIARRCTSELFFLQHVQVNNVISIFNSEIPHIKILPPDKNTIRTQTIAAMNLV